MHVILVEVVAVVLLDSAVSALRREVDLACGEAPGDQWRWHVRQRLSLVRDALGDEHVVSRDGWLSARAGGSERTRAHLLARVTLLGWRILAVTEAEPAVAELRRLVVDLEHYRQRLHDLAYDTVSLELGGSE